MNLNYNNNLKFFHPKSILMYVGGVIAILGIPAFIVAQTLLAALPFVGVGALCIAINRELNTKETEVRAELKRVTDELEKEIEDRYYDSKHPFPKMLVTVVGDYVYGEDGILLRHLKMGKPISSSYHAAAFGFKNGKLHVLDRKFSLIRDDLSENCVRLDFLDVDRFDYSEVEKGGITCSILSLYKTDGTLVVSVPAPTDYAMQKFVSDSNSIFKRHRDEAAAEKE